MERVSPRGLEGTFYVFYFLFGCGGLDLNQRPLGYEPSELPDCSTPQCLVMMGGVEPPFPIGQLL